MAIELAGRSGRELRATAQSIGGGMAFVTQLDGRPVRLDGKSYEVLVLVEGRKARAVETIVAADGRMMGRPARSTEHGQVLLSFKRTAPPRTGGP